MSDKLHPYQFPDRLVDLRKGYGALGVSVDQGRRREKNPDRYPGWPIRRVVGRGKNGYQLYRLLESEIVRYMQSLPKAEPATETDAAMSAKGKVSAAKRAAGKPSVELPAESAPKNGRKGKNARPTSRNTSRAPGVTS